MTRYVYTYPQLQLVIWHTIHQSSHCILTVLAMCNKNATQRQTPKPWVTLR